MKTLAVISLTAFLCCCGVQSAEQSDLEVLEEQILNSGIVVFLDFVKKVRNATEKFIQEDQFKKSRITVQEHMTALREFAKTMKNPERQDGPEIPLERFFEFTVDSFGRMTGKIFDDVLFPYLRIYRETFKNETIKDIWKEVDSYYLPGAPPIYSKPMEFLGYLLGKAVVRSQMVNMVEAGVNTLVGIGQINLNQLHDELLIILDQIKNKASEISELERQEEKNKFLVSLRTLSRLVVFYWDNILEYTENPLLDAVYLDSVKQWNEQIQLKNASEKYNVLLDPYTRQSFLNWTKLHLSEFLDAASQEYYRLGNEALGLERFNKSNRAVVKIAVIYSLPVYKMLSEVGFGFTEINRFLNRAHHIAYILEDNNYSNGKTLFEEIIRFSINVIGDVIKKEKSRYKDNQLLLPLRVIKVVVQSLWYFSPYRRYRNETELKQIESEWNHTKSIIINELMKSEAFTREELEETPNNFVQAIRVILEKLKQRTDLAEGFDKLIDPTIMGLKKSMRDTNRSLRDMWDLLLE
nr:Si:rp71-15k1.1 [Danio rerio]